MVLPLQPEVQGAQQEATEKNDLNSFKMLLSVSEALTLSLIFLLWSNSSSYHFLNIPSIVSTSASFSKSPK